MGTCRLSQPRLGGGEVCDDTLVVTLVFPFGTSTREEDEEKRHKAEGEAEEKKLAAIEWLMFFSPLSEDKNRTHCTSSGVQGSRTQGQFKCRRQCKRDHTEVAKVARIPVVEERARGPTIVPRKEGRSRE